MTCTRSQHQVYLLLERGEEDAHAASCPECGAALAVAHAMREAFPEVGAERLPPVGWQASLLTQLERGAARRPPLETPWWRRQWWTIALPAAIATAAILYLVWPHGHPPSHGPALAELRVDLSVKSTSSRQRTGGAGVGDLIVLRGSGGEGRAALWIYRGGRELVLRCPGSPGCRGDGPALEGELRLARPGSYQVLFASSPGEIPPPGATLDESISSLGLVGAPYKMIDFEVF